MRKNIMDMSVWCRSYPIAWQCNFHYCIKLKDTTEGHWEIQEVWQLCDTFQKRSKSASQLISHSEVKQSFRYFLPTVTQFVAKLIINRKDDLSIFWQAPNTKEQFLIIVTCLPLYESLFMRNHSFISEACQNLPVSFLIDYKLYYKLCDRGNASFEALLHFWV